MTARFTATSSMLALAVVATARCAAPDPLPGATRDGQSTAIAGGALEGTRYEPAREFVRKYCAGCHWKDGRDPKQKVAYPAFQVDTYDDWTSSRTILLAVLDKWNPDGDVMPPPDAIEPGDDDRRTMLDWIRRNSPNTRDGS